MGAWVLGCAVHDDDVDGALEVGGRKHRQTEMVVCLFVCLLVGVP